MVIGFEQRHLGDLLVNDLPELCLNIVSMLGRKELSRLTPSSALHIRSSPRSHASFQKTKRPISDLIDMGRDRSGLCGLHVSSLVEPQHDLCDLLRPQLGINRQR